MNIPIISLDLATKTGWALLDRTGVVSSGVQEFDLRRGESAGLRFLRFRKWLKDLIKLGELGIEFSAEQPGLLIFEHPHFRGGSATQLGVGLMTDVLAEAAMFGLEHMGVHTASLKKMSTGHGKASKDDMIKKAKDFFPGVEIIDDNHADALLLLKYGMNELGIQA